MTLTVNTTPSTNSQQIKINNGNTMQVRNTEHSKDQVQRHQRTQRPVSYANVTTSFPKKDQAIILDAIEGIDVKDYIFALAKLVPPSSILFGSRIANLRVCIYLDSSKTADNLIEVSKTVQVKDQVLPIKPLVTRNKRVVLSNVCPVIPHYVITDKLEELGIKAMTSLTFMKIGISEPGYSHILSFRRQLYISPEDEEKLPSSFQVYHEDIGYWIYTSTDSLKCFICNNTGHIAKNCPKNSPEDAGEPQNQIIPARDLQEQSQEHLTEDQIEELMNSFPPTQLFSASKDLKTTASFPEEPSIEIETDKTAGTKRPHSATTEASGIEDRESADNLMLIVPTDSSEYESDQPSAGLDGNFIMSKAGRKKKKSKQAKSPAQDERTEAQIWQDLEYEVTSSPESYPLNLKQFRSLMDVTRGKTEIKETLNKYTSNIEELVLMCQTIHPKLNRSLKNRCTRLKKRLEEFIQTAEDPTASSQDYSQQ